MKVKYCLPIIKATLTEVEQTIEKHKNEYQCFEIWVDYIQDISAETMVKLISQYNTLTFIIVFRRTNLESSHLDEGMRLDIIDSIANSKAYVDLDVKAQTKELQYFKEKKYTTSLIVSYHNYTQTPNNTSLEEVISEMKTFKPKIYKISTFCNSEKDAIRLLQLQQLLKQQEKRHIILGMGEYGKITRIFGTLWGNEFIFAPDSITESSAPGQLTKSELKTIFQIVNST